MDIKLVLLNLFILLFVDSFVISETNDLETIIILTKHGEKGVEFSYLNDQFLNNKEIWKNGLDHLTEKGKEDAIEFGKLLKEKYGRYFEMNSRDVATLIDDKPFNAQAVQLILFNLFDREFLPVIDQSKSHNYMLNGPEDCDVLNSKLRRVLRSFKIKKLFKENRELIRTVTSNDKNNPKLIQNIPDIYESIQTELNNNLKQPNWINETIINQLNEITIKLDKEYFTNESILQLQIGELLKEIRLNLIERTLQLPDPKRICRFKFSNFYVLGSNQFSALLNVFNIYEQRPKFLSSLIIELDSQSNIKMNYYDSKTKEFNEIKCDQQGDVQCKLVSFLKDLDRLIPISKKNSCLLSSLH